MTDHAIVIGIDAYSRPDWHLSAAVRDAVEFAKWVTAEGAGRATAETLHLHLSVRPEAPQPSLLHAPATRAAIRATFKKYTDERAGAEASRLWVFYAGHALAARGSGLDTAPDILPSDAADEEDVLSLAKYLQQLRVVPPAEQVFFIDACRGIVGDDDVVTEVKAFFVDLTKVDAGFAAASTQTALFATTAGHLANEFKLHGLYSKALMEGLQGRCVGLRPNAATLELELTFQTLAEHVRRRVVELGEEARRKGRPLPTQVPVPVQLGGVGTMVLAHFSPGEVPRASLRLFVSPPGALADGEAYLNAGTHSAVTSSPRHRKVHPSRPPRPGRSRTIRVASRSSRKGTPRGPGWSLRTATRTFPRS